MISIIVRSRSTARPLSSCGSASTDLLRHSYKSSIHPGGKCSRSSAVIRSASTGCVHLPRVHTSSGQQSFAHSMKWSAASLVRLIQLNLSLNSCKHKQKKLLFAQRRTSPIYWNHGLFKLHGLVAFPLSHASRCLFLQPQKLGQTSLTTLRASKSFYDGALVRRLL